MYLKIHLKALEGLEGFDVICVIVGGGPDDATVQKLSSRPLLILRSENTHISYGGFVGAYLQYPDYDFYIFQEDDYFPVVNPAEALLKVWNEWEGEKPGYLGGSLSAPNDLFGLHMNVACGLLTRQALAATFDERGVAMLGASYIEGGGDVYGAYHQVLFSRAIQNHSGFIIADYTSYYSTYYFNGDKVSLMPVGSEKFPLFLPSVMVSVP